MTRRSNPSQGIKESAAPQRRSVTLLDALQNSDSAAGTGLGPSLSCDFLTKGHRGALTVESRDGEGTGFTIALPA